MKKLRRMLPLDIENKILIPFAAISLATVVCFCIILYFTEFQVKVETQRQEAQTLLHYLQTDLELEEYRREPERLLDKYREDYRSDCLFIYGPAGQLLMGDPEADVDAMELLAQISDPALGWQVRCYLDRGELGSTFIEEQKYMILAAVAMLLAIVQASVLIAHNISDPIRRLSEVCRSISRHPEQGNTLPEEYLNKTDEAGQLARAFQAMMESIRGYTGELVRVKTLNECIVENLPLGVVAYDREGSAILINASASAMLRREDVLPAPARLADGAGKVRDYEFGVWQLREPDGSRWGTLYTIDDVTYNKHMEEKLTEDEKLAYTGKLAADVAHEIRNPLAGIRAGLQVVGRKLAEERDQKLCQGMVREVDRVNLLIENLLNLSRRRESEKTTVSINALFEELQMLYFKVAENKGILFTALVDGRLWLYVDERELRQVLINLINNSVKAMPDGGELAIRAWTGSAGVTLSVVDTGTGMSPEKLAQVLHGNGSGGLGLSIVRRLLKENGGELSMHSAPGQGTRAQIVFPGKGGAA